MINCISNTSSFKSINLGKSNFHAYLFYSNDIELNNNIAIAFAKNFVCENLNGCDACNNCKQFNANTHPDVLLINQPSIKVEDANNIITKLSTKPIFSNYKIFVILNAENINEIAQNKLLKSIEEPTNNSIFIFTASKTDKLLPTIMSRLYKIYIPKPSTEDFILMAKELKETGVDIFKYINTNLNLTEMLNFANNPSYSDTLNTIQTLLTNLKTTQDIPKVVSNLNNVDKTIFLPLLQQLFLSSLKEDDSFNANTIQFIKNNFTKKALTKCLPLIEDAYKKQIANVNFTYILDNLLFNILKEKFLCK